MANALAVLVDAGIEARQRTLIPWVVNSGFHFGLHADEMRRLLDEIEDRAAASGLYLAASLRSARARIDYFAGLIDADQLRAAVEEEATLAEQTGIPRSRIISVYFLEAHVPWLEDDPRGREAGRHRMVAIEEGLGTNLYMANTLGQWAVSLVDLGDTDGALAAVEWGRKVMEAGDTADEIILNTAEAYADGVRGAWVAADEALARARATLPRSESVGERNEVDYVDAKLRALRGDAPGARALLESLVERAEARGLRRYADRYRKDLLALGDGSQAHRLAR